MTNINDNDYILVNNSYNDFATQLALKTKQLDNLSNSADTIVNKYKAEMIRFNIYIKNSFWKPYSTEKHSVLINDLDKNNIVLHFYNQSAFKLAQIAYEEESVDKFNIITEMEKMDRMSEQGYFCAEEVAEETEGVNRIKFLINYLKKPLKTIQITSKQHNTINQLIDTQNLLNNKQSCIYEQMDYLQEEYADLISTVMEKLSEDENYSNFDMQIHNIFAVKDNNKGPWRLAFALASEI